MPVSLDGSTRTTEPGLGDGSGFRFVVRCDCGLVWRAAMVRGASGQAGSIACTCSAELVAWSGTVSFKLSSVASV